ncbi:hypothetical protein FN846DRAFT_892395 [Sphaerosporella brunnea]|uniref:Endo-1,3(4)-beta-glucanase 1 carbohydrate binding domain-containing protein n=1 Tax=Sphaerosporella brunnea TaxID=1250544 RepID=A0A5J5EPV4_9PEZI|nr:hypothetical protein FN846DRAFT_892395 [Sphaerosporella brunnea]
MARFPVLKSLCILSVFLFSTGSYSAVIDIRQAPAVTTAPETCLPAALTPLTSLHFHRSSSTTVSLVDRRATTTTVLPPAIFDRRAPAPTTVEGLDDGTKEELKDSMKYYNEFLEFRVGHKGPLSGQSGFRGGLPIPGVTTPTPYVTLAARSLPLCRGQAFDPHTRYCHHNEATGVSILCPVHDGVRYLGCGNGCYHPKAYYCENEDSPNARIVQRNSFVPVKPPTFCFQDHRLTPLSEACSSFEGWRPAPSSRR